MSALDGSHRQEHQIPALPAPTFDRSVTSLRPAPPIAEIGTVMIQEGVMLPDGFVLDSDRYAIGWRAVQRTDDFGVDHNLRLAGWHMFTIAGGKFQAMTLGSTTSGLRRLVIRLLALVRQQSFNSAEVTDITNARFLGIPYTSVTVHARHIQQNYCLADERSRAQAQQNTDWARS